MFVNTIEKKRLKWFFVVILISATVLKQKWSIYVYFIFGATLVYLCIYYHWSNNGLSMFTLSFDIMNSI